MNAQTEYITVKFDTDEKDVVHVTLDYEIESIPPRIVVDALRDLADDEERSYKQWCKKREMEEDLQKRRN